MDKGGKDPKVLAQAAKHFEKFFTSEVRRKSVRKKLSGFPFRCSPTSWTISLLSASFWMFNLGTLPISTQI